MYVKIHQAAQLRFVCFAMCNYVSIKGKIVYFPVPSTTKHIELLQSLLTLLIGDHSSLYFFYMWHIYMFYWCRERQKDLRRKTLNHLQTALRFFEKRVMTMEITNIKWIVGSPRTALEEKQKLRPSFFYALK